LENRTRGGRNAWPLVWNPETRNKQRASWTPERRAQQGDRLRGVPRSAEAIAAVSAVLTGRKLSLEHRAALSESHKGPRTSPAQIAADDAARGVPCTDDRRSKIVAAMARPEIGDKISAALIGVPKTSEARAAHAAAMARPEVRARISASIKGKPWSDARRAAHNRRKGSHP